jgi:hypothetical protein
MSNTQQHINIIKISMNKLTYKSLNEWGRRGNQYFEVSSLIGLANRYGAKPCIPTDWKHRNETNIPEEYYEDIEPEITASEKVFHHEPDLLETYTNYDSVNLEGCLQSVKYFEPIQDKIKEWLTPEVQDLGEWSVGLHWRCGDYLYHPGYVNYGPEYYLSAIRKYFNDPRYKFYVCSDDIEHCKAHFHGEQFIIEQRSEIEDFKTLVACNNHIIANSTFSWWGAYLSKGNGINIRPPKIFAGRMAHYDEKDFWVDEWIKHEDFKTDLTDVTFIIPVKYDHPDRRENLKITTDFLFKSFDTNIIIGEQGGKYFKGLGYEYVRFPYAEFHRTKMLNRMTEIADTPIVINWDADALLSPFQVFEMVQMLRGEHDVVYPYDGRFLRVGSEVYTRVPEIIKKVSNGDIGNLVGYEFEGEDDSSVGGVVGYKKDSFIKAGMENEHFIAYTPEDVERKYRFDTLELNVGRTWGALYHLNHYCGTSSTTANPFYQLGLAELNKIRSMDKEALTKYIKTWEWLDDRKVTFVCYADDNFQKEQERLFNLTQEYHPFDETLFYNRQHLELTQFYKDNKDLLDEETGGGNCAWKPYFILEAMKQSNDGDVVFYMDSADVFSGDIRTHLLSETRKHDIILTNGAFKNSDWTKMDCFVAMGCYTPEYTDAIQLEAGVCIFKKTNKVVKFLNEWLTWCCNKRAVSAKKEYKNKNTEGFKEHRYDQSILTNLKIKHNLFSSDGIRRLVTCNAPYKPKIDIGIENMTFVIPVAYDGKDRLNNLTASVTYLKGFTDNIIVGEQGTNPGFQHFKNYAEYIYFKDIKKFHRTKMINLMVEASNSEVVVNYDADVIVPTASLYEALRLISEGVDIVYPYTRFIKLNKDDSDKVRNSLNADQFVNNQSMDSVGGCVVFRKDSFLRAGGENERMVSWGLEDYERFHRFKKLGLLIERVDGPIYHLFHPVGINSGMIHPDYMNNRSEYVKVRDMDPQLLRIYVNGWSKND